MTADGRKTVRGLKDAARYARDRAPWVKPSRAQQLADGGYFGEDGMWVTFVCTRAEIATIAAEHNLKKRAVSRNSTTGVRGVSRMYSGQCFSWDLRKAYRAALNTDKYYPRIIFYRATITPSVGELSEHLGDFYALEDAIAARKAAELKYWKED